jgi:hypothetical protein
LDGLQVLLVTGIISFFIRRPYNDETLDFNDPFTEALIANSNEPSRDGFFNYNNISVKGKT